MYRKDDWAKKLEQDRIKKEEAERKKKEDDAKRAAAKKEKEEKEKKEKEEKLKEEQAKAAAEAAERMCPEIKCNCLDILLKPIEDKMDSYLGSTIDPFTGKTHETEQHLKLSCALIKAINVESFLSFCFLFLSQRPAVYQMAECGHHSFQLQHMVCNGTLVLSVSHTRGCSLLDIC